MSIGPTGLVGLLLIINAQEVCRPSLAHMLCTKSRNRTFHQFAHGHYGLKSYSNTLDFTLTQTQAIEPMLF